MTAQTPLSIPETPALHDAGDGRTVCLPAVANLRHTLEVRNDGAGTYLSSACRECGAFFENGRPIGHNPEAALAL